jgi:hypothetical protein
VSGDYHVEFHKALDQALALSIEFAETDAELLLSFLTEFAENRMHSSPSAGSQ